MFTNRFGSIILHLLRETLPICFIWFIFREGGIAGDDGGRGCKKTLLREHPVLKENKDASEGTKTLVKWTLLGPLFHLTKFSVNLEFF
jgi:hypothetical protein